MSSVPGRRIPAYVADLAAVYLWGAVLFLLSAWLFPGGVERWVAGDPWKGQLVGLLTMTLPVVFAFSAFEAQEGATPGKRLCRLRVRAADGGRLRFPRALGRNLVKFAPWELGHLSVWHALYADGATPPAWTTAVGALAALVPLWWLMATLIRGRCPYDRWTGTMVVPSGC